MRRIPLLLAEVLLLVGPGLTSCSTGTPFGGYTTGAPAVLLAPEVAPTRPASSTPGDRASCKAGRAPPTTNTPRSPLVEIPPVTWSRGIGPPCEEAWGLYDVTYNQGYRFRTPESYTIEDDYRASRYVRPLSVWAIERALA